MASVNWNGQSRIERVYDISMKALNLSARRRLGNLLDPPKTTFSTTCGIQQDWEGLAELMGLTCDDIQSFKAKDGKTYHLLEYYSQKSNSTIGKLFEYLVQIERFDVLEDQILQERILADVELFKHNQLESRISAGLVQKPLQVSEVDSSVYLPPCSSPYDVSSETEFKNITVGEVKTGKPEYFDAFVCNAPEDIAFVKQLINILEEQNGLKLCIKNRDLTAGSPGDTVVAFLISERCKKMIIVLSPNFQRCPECDFMVKFGQSLCPGARTKKLVPIIIQQPCDVPNILRFITVVDYTKCGLAEWFWSRVTHSLKEISFIDTNTEYGRKYALEHGINAQLNNTESQSDSQMTEIVKDGGSTERMESVESSGLSMSSENHPNDTESMYSTSYSCASTKPILQQSEEKKSGSISKLFKKKTHRSTTERETASLPQKHNFF